MQRINAEAELDKIQGNGSKTNYLFLPLLVFGCIFGFVGFTFSGNVVTDEVTDYMVYIDIVNGNETTYIKKVKSGEFKDTIDVDRKVKSLECSSGLLYYDEESKTIYDDNLDEDTRCTLTFMEDEYDPMTDIVINDNEAILETDE